MEVAPESPDDANITWATKVHSTNDKAVTNNNRDTNNGNTNETDSTSASSSSKGDVANDDVTRSKENGHDIINAEQLSSLDLENGMEVLKSHLLKVLFKVRQRGNFVEKLIFVTSIACLMLSGYGIVAFPFILPYFYTGALPFLVGLRIWLYWNKKWQLFLLDFCYFANLLCLIYIWACPGIEQVLCVAFAVSNGPLLYAIITYRNTLAFHSLDRMTSVFIHLLPSLLTFSIRWYPSSIMPWYTSFADVDLDGVAKLPWMWILAVPYGLYILHSIIYFTVVYLFIKPNEEYWDTYRYMTGDSGGIIAKVVNVFGPKYRPVVFITLNWIYTLITFLFAVLWFKSFIAHCIFLAKIGLVLVWNGASFYLDVFSEKGLDAEPYRFCAKKQQQKQQEL